MTGQADAGNGTRIPRGAAAIQALTPESYRCAIRQLSARDARLAAIVACHGVPPFWTQCDGFAGITWAILGQQVSIESAQAVFDKLETLTGTLTPAAFLRLDAAQLKTAGFSHQKASYVGTIAGQLLGEQLDLDALRLLQDDEVREQLMMLRGVGRWTAATYLLFSLRRPDVWPSGDLALEKAVSELEGSAAQLDTAAVDGLAARWTPWRAVAARLLWFQYLKRRGRMTSTQCSVARRVKN
jgi:DNA-3-methyladenine glycosylase II